VDVVIHYADGTTERLHQTPAIWSRDLKRAVVSVRTRKAVQSVELDGGIWMDAREEDNKWTARR
jgi:hypothetical protein